MRFVCILLVCFLASTTASRVVIWGERSKGDVLLERAVIKEPWELLRIVSSDYTFSQENRNYRRVITQVVAVDQKQKGEDGVAKLLDGGPQTDYVKIHFESRRSYSLHFMVYIYGK